MISKRFTWQTTLHMTQTLYFIRHAWQTLLHFMIRGASYLLSEEAFASLSLRTSFTVEEGPPYSLEGPPFSEIEIELVPFSRAALLGHPNRREECDYVKYWSMKEHWSCCSHNLFYRDSLSGSCVIRTLEQHLNIYSLEGDFLFLVCPASTSQFG